MALALAAFARAFELSSEDEDSESASESESEEEEELEVVSFFFVAGFLVSFGAMLRFSSFVQLRSGSVPDDAHPYDYLCINLGRGSQSVT